METSGTAKSELIEQVLTKLRDISASTDNEFGELPVEINTAYQQYKVAFIEFIVEKYDVEKIKHDGNMRRLLYEILAKHADCVQIIIEC